MAACKSKTHTDYSNALEGLYVQTHLAQQALTAALEQARAAHDPYVTLAATGQTKLDEATDRLAYGKAALDKATAAVNAHFDRGCSNLPVEVSA